MVNLAHGDMHILKPTISVRKMRNYCSELCSINKSTIHLHLWLIPACVTRPWPFLFRVIASFSISYNLF